MSEADWLLRAILEHGDVVGRDGLGRPVIQLVVDDAVFDRLMAFGADDPEEDADVEPCVVPPVSHCWSDLTA